MHPFQKAKLIVKKLPATVRAIDFGAGDAKWVARQAKIRPNDRYVAVDTEYVRHPKRPRIKNLTILPAQAGDVIEMLKKEGKRTKYAVVRMPIPGYTVPEGSARALFDLRELISEAKNFLTPDGAILITTESERVERHLVEVAQENGMRIKKRPLGVPITEWEKKQFKNKSSIHLYMLKLNNSKK